MSFSKEAILCPDCGFNFISKDRYNLGKICTSCTHRKLWAQRKGESYIRFKDLPEEKQLEYLGKREALNGKKQYKDHMKNSIIQKNDRRLIENQQPKTGKHERCKLNPAIKNFIYNKASSDLSVRELYNLIISTYDESDLNLDLTRLQRFIYREKLPFRRCTKEERAQLLNDARKKINETKDESDCTELRNTSVVSCTDNQIDTIQDDKIIDDKTSVDVDFGNKQVFSSDTKQPIEEVKNSGLDDRFKPIEDEVQSVLNCKFKEVGCELDYDFKVEDYITTFRVIRYLINNYPDINTKRNDQWDIANRYQTDIIHEMEAVVSAPGDTYMQDKCHVLRNIRRNYELDKRAIEIMKPFLASISNKSADISEILEKLDHIKESVDDLVYVPNVDISMVEKYDWAKATNVSPRLMQKSLLTSNSKFNRRKGNPVFKASCYLSGNGYGVFKYWSKEYSYPTEEEADKVAKMDIENIKKRNGGLLVTNYKLTRMDRYYDR